MQRKKCFRAGTAFQQPMTDQSLQQRRSFSMSAGWDLVGGYFINMLPINMTFSSASDCLVDQN